MRWEDERYVRFYTRDTPEFLAMSWLARALFGLIMRKVDRAGILVVGRLGLKGVAVAVGGVMVAVGVTVAVAVGVTTSEAAGATASTPALLTRPTGPICRSVTPACCKAAPRCSLLASMSLAACASCEAGTPATITAASSATTAPVRRVTCMISVPLHGRRPAQRPAAAAF